MLKDLAFTVRMNMMLWKWIQLAS